LSLKPTEQTKLRDREKNRKDKIKLKKRREKEREKTSPHTISYTDVCSLTGHFRASYH
jgi:hypothetical protein